MSHDIVADALNQIMNAKRARKNSVIVKRHSKLLLRVLELAKREGYIKNLEQKDKKIEILFGLNECNAIKPRFNVSVKRIDRYVRRYLPGRDFGVIIMSTSKGLLTHKEAMEKNIGGSLIAYFF